MLQSVRDQVVVITGGSSGYGKATAKLLAEAGAQVIITGRDEQALRQAAEEIPGIEAYRSDATRWEDWQRLFALVMKKHGRVDVLVNNAGGGVAIADTVDQPVEIVDEIIALNLNSVVYGSMIFGKQMQAQGSGTIINISSACATEAWPKFSVYAAAKSGVVSLSKGMYTELRPHGVRVTAVIPGAGATNFSKAAGLAEPAVPFFLKPEDMAEVILHICQMPAHIEVEEYRFWGMDQEVIPM
jgi:NAD(P)-dependent dehydrogenase (short-subunit alcohol dehydrogenase family)